MQAAPGPAGGVTPRPTQRSDKEVLTANEREIVLAVLKDPSVYALFRAELDVLELQDSTARKLLLWCREQRAQGEGSDALTEVVYRPGEDQSSGFETDSHSTTSIGTLVRMYCGGKPSDPKIAGGCAILQKKLPDWDKKHFYYWYYGTLTTFQQGGEMWKKWNEALKKTLVENQRKGGDEDGSWDAEKDYYGYWFGGRVYTTALGALSLEVYYRYLPLYR